MMDLKDYIFSSVMVVSAFVLTHTWLTRFGPSNSVIVVSAMLMVGALAAMILSIEMRLRRMEQDIEKKHASMKFAVESVRVRSAAIFGSASFFASLHPLCSDCEDGGEDQSGGR